MCDAMFASTPTRFLNTGKLALLIPYQTRKETI
jgi:hypothetical protein